VLSNQCQDVTQIWIGWLECQCHGSLNSRQLLVVARQCTQSVHIDALIHFDALTHTFMHSIKCVNCSMASDSSPVMAKIRNAGYTTGLRNTESGNCDSNSSRSTDDSTNSNGLDIVNGIDDDDVDDDVVVVVVVDAVVVVVVVDPLGRCANTKARRSFNDAMFIACLVCTRRTNCWPAGYIDANKRSCSWICWSVRKFCPSKIANVAMNGRCVCSLFSYRMVLVMSSISMPLSDGASPYCSIYTR
jgi:hypothetical protein